MSDDRWLSDLPNFMEPQPVTLEVARFGVTTAVARPLLMETASWDVPRQQAIYRLEAHLLAAGAETMTARATAVVLAPSSWWDHLKLDLATNMREKGLLAITRRLGERLERTVESHWREEVAEVEKRVHTRVCPHNLVPAGQHHVRWLLQDLPEPEDAGNWWVGAEPGHTGWGPWSTFTDAAGARLILERWYGRQDQGMAVWSPDGRHTQSFYRQAEELVGRGDTVRRR